MGDVAEITKEVFKFVDSRNARLAFASLFISTCSIAVISALVSVKYDTSEGWHVEMPPNYKLAFIVSFLILFISGWFILYILGRSDSTDVYVEVRNRLVGRWLVTYDANHGEDGVVIAPERTMSCDIDLSPEKKLVFSFCIGNHPIFDPSARQQIRDIALRYNEDGGYTMLYHYKAERGLSSKIDYILDSDGNIMSRVDVEIFARVTFDKPIGKNKINMLRGTWYDLNGNMSRLYHFIEAHTIAKKTGMTYQPLSFWVAVPHPRNFSADMGTLTFTR